MKLSIIIPVYNVEKYISSCLDSIIKKIVSGIEIILVDDGSTDLSGEICDNYALQYSEIQVFHNKNSGASAARNYGIKKALGKYIMFVDSDDFLADDFEFSILLDEMKKDYDVIQYKMMLYFEEQNKFIKNEKKLLLENEKNVSDILLNEVTNGTLSVSPCDKIVKRNVIINNKLYFNENIVAEDIDWSLSLYLKVKTISVINENVYCYRQNRIGSVTNTISDKHIESLIYIIEKWRSYNYENDIQKDTYLNYLAYQYIMLVLIINVDCLNTKYINVINKNKDLLKYSKNYKVNLCNKIFKILGFNNGIKVLVLYLKLKKNGIIKI